MLRKAHSQKIGAQDYMRQPRCNIKIMRDGSKGTQALLDAFEIKFFDKDAGCRIERRKRPLALIEK